ncbi:ATP-binding protein [Sphingobacterium sp. SGG-5]|uniref:AlbA family DNA-binding domain-containing protein n=1 Tax=Sphingobacterium sp. SGG-5 TaxID=2710881 RepID=UPI0013EA6319|nr:ATP-binding protein [Sphingobacterium sp. SGG-5]NGM63447.1 ATP-binding protein [Sphingobacterium sp. SGG-5]
MNKDLRPVTIQGEDKAAEFKASFSDEVIISLGAFSNTKGGTVYIGISDNGEVKGVALHIQEYPVKPVSATGVQNYGGRFSSDGFCFFHA